MGTLIIIRLIRKKSLGDPERKRVKVEWKQSSNNYLLETDSFIKIIWMKHVITKPSLQPFFVSSRNASPTLNSETISKCYASALASDMVNFILKVKWYFTTLGIWIGRNRSLPRRVASSKSSFSSAGDMTSLGAVSTCLEAMRPKISRIVFN